MPSPKRVAWAQLKVGLLAAVSLGIVVVLIFLLTGANNPFASKELLYAYFPDSAAMTEGSVVRLNGIQVGTVKRVELSGEANNRRAIRMTLEVDGRYLPNIPKDSEGGFGAENVLGVKYLNIERGTSSEAIRPGSELHTRDDKDFMEMLRAAYPLLDSMQTILQRVDRLVAGLESGRGSVGKLLYDDEAYRRLNAILADAEKVSHALAAGEGTLGKLLYDPSLYEEVQGTMKRVDGLVANLAKGEGSAGKFLKDPALYDDLKKSSAELNKLISNLNAGKGSAGKLLTDDTAHKEFTGALQRLNGTLDKLNAGQGTIGQLMVNPALYNDLTGTSSEVRDLLKDFRKNPKKFLTIQLKIF